MSLVNKRVSTIIACVCLAFTLFCGQVKVYCCDGNILVQIKELFYKHCIFRERLVLLNHLKCSNINKVLKKIDPYSKWVSSGKELRASNGEVVGVGAMLLQKKDRFFLVPYRFSSIYDYSKGRFLELFAIDGWIVRGKRYVEVAKRLMGKEDSLVRLSVKHGKRLKSFYVVRQRYRPPAVDFISKGNNLLIRIFHFNGHEVTNLIKSRLYSKGIKSVIFDLRACPGGDLFEALDLASLFLAPETPLVLLRDSKGKAKIMKAPSNLPTFDYRLTIITGHMTASAAEIFAGIIKYHKRGSLKGTNTAGKCVSQRDFRLEDGSRVRITNLAVYFPDGSTCQGSGLYKMSNMEKLH